MKITILYYTSNQEGNKFEERVKQNILKVKKDIPIISVSQKPIDFGHNICVGEHGASGFNMFRQVQIGLRKVKTPFVVSAEADCLYPPKYFTHIPRKLDVAYRSWNTYVMPQWRAFFFHKYMGATHSQVVGTKYYLNRLNKLFEGAPDWSTKEKNFPKERTGMEDVFDEVILYKSRYPVVQIKTTRSMRHYTFSDRTPVLELPHWGDGKEFRKKYYGDE